jgi:hypothetical protein
MSIIVEFSEISFDNCVLPWRSVISIFVSELLPRDKFRMSLLGLGKK